MKVLVSIIKESSLVANILLKATVIFLLFYNFFIIAREKIKKMTEIDCFNYGLRLSQLF